MTCVFDKLLLNCFILSNNNNRMYIIIDVTTIIDLIKELFMLLSSF